MKKLVIGFLLLATLILNSCDIYWDDNYYDRMPFYPYPYYYHYGYRPMNRFYNYQPNYRIYPDRHFNDVRGFQPNGGRINQAPNQSAPRGPQTSPQQNNRQGGGGFSRK